MHREKGIKHLLSNPNQGSAEENLWNFQTASSAEQSTLVRAVLVALRACREAEGISARE